MRIGLINQLQGRPDGGRPLAQDHRGDRGHAARCRPGPRRLSGPAIHRDAGGSVGVDSPTVRRYWEALSGSGTVVEPLEVAPWGDAFGMCVDRFGITWMVNIAGSPA